MGIHNDLQEFQRVPCRTSLELSNLSDGEPIKIPVGRFE